MFTKRSTKILSLSLLYALLASLLLNGVALATIPIAAPEFTNLELIQSTDLATWTAVTGELSTGFELTLDPGEEYFYLNVNNATVTTNVELEPGMVPFYLDTASLPASFYAYWEAKGVKAGAGGWEGHMWQIINGTQPMFYMNITPGLKLVVNGPAQTFSLIDGLMKDVFATIQPFQINGNYPAGDYTLSGDILDTNGNSDTVNVSMTLKQPIVVDGLDLGDWIGINPSIVDGPDADVKDKGTDITEVYVAYDATTTYIRIDTVEQPNFMEPITVFLNIGRFPPCVDPNDHTPGVMYDVMLQYTPSSSTPGAYDGETFICSGGTFSSVPVGPADGMADNIVELRAPPLNVADPRFYVKYGSGTDYAPDEGGGGATLVDMVGMRGALSPAGVTLTWETASEVANAGFNVWGSTDGVKYTQRNDTLIAAAGGPTQGAVYSFVDAGATGGWYKIEDIDINGVGTMHGPIEIGAAPNAVSVGTFAAYSSLGFAFVGALSALGLLRRKKH